MIAGYIIIHPIRKRLQNDRIMPQHKTFIFAAIERSNTKQKRPICIKAQAINEQEARKSLTPTHVILGWMGQIVNRN
ncbi:host cell division inhibitor Icd-like protein [Xenorhabdus bovienii]|nr:host cell division inhibitor Icd-like protein [Xenorhabdus bovienii]